VVIVTLLYFLDERDGTMLIVSAAAMRSIATIAVATSSSPERDTYSLDVHL